MSHACVRATTAASGAAFDWGQVEGGGEEVDDCVEQWLDALVSQPGPAQNRDGLQRDGGAVGRHIRHDPEDQVEVCQVGRPWCSSGCRRGPSHGVARRHGVPEEEQRGQAVRFEHHLEEALSQQPAIVTAFFEDACAKVQQACLLSYWLPY